MPPVSTRMTVPSNGSSPTRRLDPPPSTSSGSPPDHTSRSAVTSSSVVCASIMRSGTPPVRSVVSWASGIGSTSGIGYASRTRTCALPSTVVSPWVTVRSMRALSSSTAPTFATICS